jgi:hypothetical protein
MRIISESVTEKPLNVYRKLHVEYLYIYFVHPAMLVSLNNKNHIKSSQTQQLFMPVLSQQHV